MLSEAEATEAKLHREAEGANCESLSATLLVLEGRLATLLIGAVVFLPRSAGRRACVSDAVEACDMRLDGGAMAPGGLAASVPV